MIESGNISLNQQDTNVMISIHVNKIHIRRYIYQHFEFTKTFDEQFEEITANIYTSKKL